MQRMNENRSMENRPLGDLFGDLATDMSNLVRQEVTLAKLEITQKAKYFGRNVGYLVIGGAVAYAALLAIIAGIIMLLAKVVPNWGSALIVGVVYVAIAAALALAGRAQLKRATPPVPEQAVETTKDMVLVARAGGLGLDPLHGYVGQRVPFEPPMGTVYNYPPRGDEQTSIAGAPARTESVRRFIIRR